MASLPETIFPTIAGANNGHDTNLDIDLYLKSAGIFNPAHHIPEMEARFVMGGYGVAGLNEDHQRVANRYSYKARQTSNHEFVGSANMLRSAHVFAPAVTNYWASGIRVSTAGALREIMSDLTRWRTLQPNWDGEEDTAPEPTAIDNATALLLYVFERSLPFPKHYISGDGEVGFEWKNSGRFGSLAFPTDGNIVAYMRTKVGKVAVRIDEPFTPDVDLSTFFDRLPLFV